MAASTSENLLLAGAGFLVIACVFFILTGFVFSVKVPNTNAIFAQLSGETVNESSAVESSGGVNDYGVLWFALLGLSIVVMLIGARLVWINYVVKGR